MQKSDVSWQQNARQGRPTVLSQFHLDQSEAMNHAFKQACLRLGLTGSTPVIELVAVRIVELARAGELDIEALTDTVSTEFGAHSPSSTG
jgi:uncharacterized membrane protein